jgi:hypothetical protein
MEKQKMFPPLLHQVKSFPVGFTCPQHPGNLDVVMMTGMVRGIVHVEWIGVRWR